MKRPRFSVSNVVAVLVALWLGATCAGCAGQTPPPGATEPDSVFWMINPRPAYPTPLHLAVWRMVEGCVGLDHSETDVVWLTADTIVGDPSRAMAYGLTIRPRDGKAPILVIERAMWLNPSVLSHELVHLLAKAGETQWQIERCTVPIGVELRQRFVRSLQPFRGRGLPVRRQH